MYQQPTQPLPIAGVLDSGFKLYSASYKQTFWIAALAALVTTPLGIVARRAALAGPPSAGTAGTLFAAFVVVALVSLVLNGTLIARTDAAARGEELGVAEALTQVIRRVPALIAVSFLYSLLVGLGLLLLIVPGVLFSIWWVFALPAVIIRGLGPIESMSYSRALVRGNWWRTAVLLTIVTIVAVVLYVVLGIVAGLVVATNPEQAAAGSVPWYVEFVLSPIIAAVITPLAYSMFVAIFYDLQLRREGGDLAARIAATA